MLRPIHSLYLFMVCFCLCCDLSSCLSTEDTLTTIIKNADVCSKKNDSAETELVIIVDSDSRNMNIRNRIRGLKRYWLSERTKNVPIVFFMEQPSADQDTYHDVLLEEEAHHDTVWTTSRRKLLDEEEDKTELFFNWINTMCNGTEFVLKIPDNITVDFQKIMKIIDENHEAHNTLWTFPKPTNPIEWDSHYLYGEKVYLMTGDVIRLLLDEINRNDVMTNRIGNISGLVKKYEDADKNNFINFKTIDAKSIFNESTVH